MTGWVKDTIQVVSVGLVTAIFMAGVATPFTIDGESMEPTLHDGDVVLVNRLVYQWKEPQPDDLVIISTEYGKMAKKIIREVEPDKYWVEGDNKNFSTDSRTFGPIAREHVVGKIGITLWNR